MRRRVDRQIGFYCVAIVCVALASAGVAQDGTGLSVTGRGKIKAAPTVAEINGTISADAELTGDALTKFRTAKVSAYEGIKKLGIENLSIESSGFGIGPLITSESSSSIIMRSRQGTPEPPKVLVQESLRMHLKQIDKMDRDKLMENLAKIIDSAKEAGVTFGPPLTTSRISMGRDEFIGFVTFSVEDTQALREQAESLAVQDARAKAERLAKLTGGQLGEVRSIHESQTTILPSPLRTVLPDQSMKLDEIEFNAVLQIQFRLTIR